MSAFGYVSRTTPLDDEYELPNIGGRDDVDELVTERRKNVCFQSTQNANRNGAETSRQPTNPTIFERYFSKLFSASRWRASDSLFRMRLRLSFRHWVHTGREHLASRKVTVRGPRRD